MLYEIIRPLLFRFDPERAHALGMKGLGWLRRSPFHRGSAPVPGAARTCFGIRFANPVGIAAGLDKNADHLDDLGALGFGHVEVGTVTPRAQPGNPKPRLFRIPEARAIVNRMGFNNEGVDHLVERLKASTYAGVRGVNIGKNADTPLPRAHEDYLACYRKVYPFADYVVANVSSPNTEGLRSLQTRAHLNRIFEPLLEARRSLASETGKVVPLLVKIAPDLEDDELAEIAGAVGALGLDGIVAANTTVSRDGLPECPAKAERGGLSGAPLHARSCAIVRKVRALVGPELPIVGVGGILSGDDARKTIEAGADLVQVYTGFIYRGPTLLREIVKALSPVGSRVRATG